MKKFLQNLIARKKAELAETEKRMKDSQDVNEVRSLGETLLALRDEISDAEQQLADLENGEGEGEGEGEGGQLSNPPAGNGEGRSGNPKPDTSFNPKASYGQGAGDSSRSGNPDEDPRSTMEYRKAFMDFVKTGKRSEVLQMRSNDQNESTDLGVLLPITVIQEIMTGVEKVYGQLYSSVKKTNIKGGVRYPIGAFEATFTRIYETAGEQGTNPVAPTDRQNAGSVTGYIEFSYKMGEIRLAQTLLANILSVPVFEQELAKTIVEAYVKAMDNEILNGVGANAQMEGILTELNKETGSRIAASHIIDFTAEDMADWQSWQKNLFAKIPLSMRGLSPEFVMTPHTYEANIKTLHDDNNRPVYAETYNPVDGSERASFKGKNVLFVEEGMGIENFDDADDGEIFGFYWVGEKAYAINTNLEFAVKRYFDEEKLQYVDRAIVINDGKILNPDYLYFLRKKVTA